MKVKKIRGGLILEPVTILGYAARKYTDSEVDEFFELDEKETRELKGRGVVR